MYTRPADNALSFRSPEHYGRPVTLARDVPDIEEHRAHLIGVGYRLTGSLADAEDAVQEAWLRLHRLSGPERAGIRDPRAWLTTVVSRLCLDRLRSAAARRESYVGPWLPEPLVSTGAEDDPLAAVVRDEDVRMAAMVVLERLSPPQRVAFVLHDTLAVPFDEIAEVLGCSVTAARQHASRARRAVAEADPPPRAAAAEQRRMLAALADALARGDVEALVSLLAPDAVLVNDGGGRTRAALRPVHGADKIARLLLGLAARYGADLLADPTPLLVNGELGLRTGGRGETPASVTVLSVTGGRIVGLYSVLNPQKLSRVPGTPAPT